MSKGTKNCKIETIKRVSDSRGWFIKPINGMEAGLEHIQGEFYLVMAEPGEIRGNHFHKTATEWFSVIQGSAELHLFDTVTGERSIVNLSAEDPKSVVVKPGVAHAFLNPLNSSKSMILSAFSNQIFDPQDTILLKLIN